MKKMIAVAAMCLASAGAFAQGVDMPAAAAANPRVEHAMQQLQGRFANANTTHDGKLTREQAAAGMPMVAKHFDQIDAQRTGYVTLPQIEGFMGQMMMSR
ncbi:EF-hand domain-containing protein [Cupriavidus consociatus]|uniref:EF-hand domain-containing protein n=1 Tax=Cupriavidus consociatus TaxID=2821357 RepID=UPI001AE64BD6|nr:MULTISPECIES: EF-hand domain-containing protein [unclassified Cupriavidus]MBP0619844.1 EF-hand domain-containing protein [Cupriavidus sp. LEh25]MDK2656498.1 EF-hand domain-containing protein [Cupriavidus sp. LEh21]